MNKRKVWHILDFIRGQGQLPSDPFGQILAVDDLMAWFGLGEQLSPEERRLVRVELAAMAEAQMALDRIKIYRQLQADGGA